MFLPRKYILEMQLGLYLTQKVKKNNVLMMSIIPLPLLGLSQLVTEHFGSCYLRRDVYARELYF
jgi:hypothetical protein